MAPHWTLALLLMISVFLGIGRASVTCNSDGNTQCVAEKHCSTAFNYRLNIKGCSLNEVCCAVDDINYGNPANGGVEEYSCGQDGKGKCVTNDLCRPQVDFRNASPCPGKLVCCEVEVANNLSIQDPDV